MKVGAVVERIPEDLGLLTIRPLRNPPDAISSLDYGGVLSEKSCRIMEVRSWRVKARKEVKSI